MMIMFIVLAFMDRQTDIDRGSKDEEYYNVWKEKSDLKEAQKDPRYWKNLAKGAQDKYHGLKGAVNELKGQANTAQGIHEQYRAI